MPVGFIFTDEYHAKQLAYWRSREGHLRTLKSLRYDPVIEGEMPQREEESFRGKAIAQGVSPSHEAEGQEWRDQVVGEIKYLHKKLDEHLKKPKKKRESLY